MNVTDLYTMIPQEGGVTVIKNLIEACGLKQIDGVKKKRSSYLSPDLL